MDRRHFIASVAAGAATLAGAGKAGAQTSQAKARVVIAGAGAAGLSVAARLARAMPNATITLVDAKKEPHFQPGLTLVGAGLWTPGYITENNADYIPSGVNLVNEAVAEFDPVGNKIVTASGKALAYDYLVVATGLKLDYAAIDGMSTDLIGKNGIASVYAGPAFAQASAQAIDTFIEKGGIGHFGRPSTEMKCAGAPLKMTFITEDKSRMKNRRSAIKLVYNAHNTTVFSVKPVNDKVIELFTKRDVAIQFGRELVAIDPGKRLATFKTAQGPVEENYDFIHVIPPMRAPDAVRNSPLPWQSGPFVADGWIEADKSSLRHPRFPNVFSIGDVAGVPRGKTAASVKWQVPVVIDHLVSLANDKSSTASYNGYTSCPLITEYGKAMLVEFDYDGKLVPSFPFIDPLQELWISWLIDEKGLIGAYRAMLRGRA